MKHPKQRQSIFIDRPVQLALLFRAVLYLAVSLMAQLLMVFFFAFITSPPDDFFANAPKLWWYLQLSLLAWVVLIPIILLDLLKLSHRWVGPIFRLQTSLHALGQGEKIPPVRFRDGDFWPKLAGDLNMVAAKLECQSEIAPEGSVVSESLPATNVREAVHRPESSPTSAAI